MQDDRREYFRISDTAFLAAANYRPDRPAIADYFPQLHQIAVLKEFESVDAQLGEFLDRVKDAATRKLLGLFNEKLELMSRYLHIRDAQEQQLTAQAIDISEGGCSGWLTGQYKEGQELALAIIFTPSYVSLFCRARVAEAQAEAEGTRLHLEFIDLPERERQLLTRHMFRVQARSR